MKCAIFPWCLIASGLVLIAGCAKPVQENTAVNTAEKETNTDQSIALDAAERSAETLDENQSDAAKPKSRKFEFNYDVAISDLAPGAKARVWVPIAQSAPFQEVSITKISTPVEYEETTDEKLGNKFIYFEATANDDGEVPISISYTVERQEVTPANAVAVEQEKVAQLYLASDSLVPVDGSLTQKMFGEKVPTGDAKAKARQMYDAVESRMEYGKPADKAWGRGDSHFACDEKVGNCTDFHSLFISLARDQKIPAKFEIGFPIPTDTTEGEVGGYHCWAYFSDGKNWLPVDISEADKHPELKEYYFTRLTPDRVTFTEGRDLKLQPSPAAESVNFLVYPYAEVDGQPYPNLRKSFSFNDIK